MLILNTRNDEIVKVLSIDYGKEPSDILISSAIYLDENHEETEEFVSDDILDELTNDHSEQLFELWKKKHGINF